MAYPTTDNVLLVYNSATTSNPNFSDVTQSKDIADYAEATFPGVHKIGIDIPDGVRSGTYGEDIARADYESYIRDVIRAAIIAGGWSIYYIVLCKGIPHRIPGSGTTYSSVDCELCTLEDDFNDVYDPSSLGYNLGANPYYNYNFTSEPCGLFLPGVFTNAVFSGDGVSYLVTRLDGYTVAQVKAMIDKAAAPFTGGGAYYVLDDDPTKGYDQMGDAHTRLNAIGENNDYDNTNAFITIASGDVIGYVGHGIHHINAPPSSATYIIDDLSFILKNGAICTAYESFFCWSFGKHDGSASGRNGQGQISDWVQIGGSGGCGYCYEPYQSGIAHEEIFMKAFAVGYPLADAFYLSLAWMSWTSVVIGWPLMRIATLNDTAPSAPTGVSSSRVVNTITVTWNANTECDLAGYIVYWDTNSGVPYANSQDVGNVLTYDIDISGAPNEIYFISVSAYDAATQEGSKSTEIRDDFLGGCQVMGRLHQQGSALVGGDVSGNSRGTNSIDIQNHRSAVTQVANGVSSIAIGTNVEASGNYTLGIGRNSTASAIYSISIGETAVASGSHSTAIGAFAYASGVSSVSIGHNSAARIDKTSNLGGPLINRKDSGEVAGDAFQSFCGVEVVLMSKEVDLKAVAAHTITLPAGCKFWWNSCGIIATSVTVGGGAQPTVSFGITGTTNKQVAAAPTTALTAAGKREIETPLVPEDGETSLVMDVTVASTYTTLLGRGFFVGLLVEDE